MTSTIVCQTSLNLHRLDLNVRRIFCGEQDHRLNELRYRTGAIIDLQILQGTFQSFESVQWRITHPNRSICDFVCRRLNTWRQLTQLFCDMAHEDYLFLGGNVTDDEEKDETLTTNVFEQKDLTDRRVPFADILAVSKLAQFLRENSSLTIDEIFNKNSIDLTHQIHQGAVEGQIYLFHRIVLNGHILFPLAVSNDPLNAKINAYQQMFDVCSNPDGIRMKLFGNDRVKVMKQNFSDLNATCLSVADLSSFVTS